MPDSPIASVLARCATDPRPRLTWYGDGGERVELSGAGLAQWATKTANLLVEELDAGPGFRVLLDLPGHWRAVVWALGVWRVGACVVVPGVSAPDAGTSRAGARRMDDDPADAVVTVSPSALAGRRGVVAVALPALARSLPAPLPVGAVDGSAVLSYGDALGYVPPADLGAPALVGPSGSATHADLVRPGGSGGRVLLDATIGPLDEMLRAALAVLAAGGSLVLVGGGHADILRADDERRARLVAAERITSWQGPPAG